MGVSWPIRGSIDHAAEWLHTWRRGRDRARPAIRRTPGRNGRAGTTPDPSRLRRLRTDGIPAAQPLPSSHLETRRPDVIVPRACPELYRNALDASLQISNVYR